VDNLLYLGENANWKAMKLNWGLLLVFTLLVIANGRAQDSYHNALTEMLKDDYFLDQVEYLLFDTEDKIVQDLIVYGDVDYDEQTITDYSFSKELTINVRMGGENRWDAGINIQNSIPIAIGDVVLITFWGRQISESSELNIFTEHHTSFNKEVELNVRFTPDWTQYFVAYKSIDAYDARELTLGFHIGFQAQEIQIGGFTALNLGDVLVEDVPSTLGSKFYGGHESNAPWRLEAEERIEQLRKRDMHIVVSDESGDPIANAQVNVEMLSHEFGFGSAFVACRAPNNRCYQEEYLERFTNLDGKGHGFNAAVMENAFKWNAWEEQWIGTPEQAIGASQWLEDQGIALRGHTLIWPGWSFLPPDMEANMNNPEYLRTRISDRLKLMLQEPTLSKLVGEWDVLNEITQERDLEKAFEGTPGFSSGREIYKLILDEVSALQPDLKNYINEYVVLSGGGSAQQVTDRYISYLDEIIDGGGKVDGIGFQCHIGTQPTSILKVKDVFDAFFQRYEVPIKVTEYDINPAVDDSTQAKYLVDLLTLCYSHPAVEAFFMWGFWDGNHWKGNAPIFNQDWSLKLSGQAYIDKVFGDWWTNENGVTNSEGVFSLRPFRGSHKVTVTINGESQEQILDLTTSDSLFFSFGTTADDDLLPSQPYEIAPNPSNGRFAYLQGSTKALVDVEIHSPEGRLMGTFAKHLTGQSLPIELDPGLYYVKIKHSDGYQILKFVVQ